MFCLKLSLAQWFRSCFFTGKELFMKLFFTLVFFISTASYAEHPRFHKRTAASSGELKSFELNHIQDQLKEDMVSLLLVLLEESTAKETQLKILDTIKEIAELNGEIVMALNQFVLRGRECAEEPNGQDCLIVDELWIKAQAELIRRETLVLAQSREIRNEEMSDFYVNLALDSVVIIAGGLLCFIPAFGQAVVLPLTFGRLTLTGQRLGALLVGIGGVQVGSGYWRYFLDEEERKTLSFIPNIVLRGVFAHEVFQILSSDRNQDKFLANSLLFSSTEQEVISILISSIQEERYSVSARRSAIQALRAFPEIDDEIKGRIISRLSEVIDNRSENQSLRLASLSVLGEIAVGVPEVAGYLEDKGKDTNESDDFRLMALMERGRNPSQFPNSIEILAEWLDERRNDENPVKIEVEIPLLFLESLLSVTKEGASNEHIIVLEELIRSRRLNLEMKIKSSETLSRWDESLKTKAFLRDIYSQDRFFDDMSAYVEELFQESWSQESQEAFDFLQESIAEAKKATNFTQSIEFIELDIKELQKKYPNQLKTAKKLEIFLKSYKKIEEFINKSSF